MNEMRIYVASLYDYNDGRLEGKWFDLSDYPDASDLMMSIQEMLEDITKKYDDGEVREEWAVHDYEGIPSTLASEYMGEQDFQKLYDIDIIAQEFGIPFEVLVERAGDIGVDDYNGYRSLADSLMLVVDGNDESDIVSEYEFQLGSLGYDFWSNHIYIDAVTERVMYGEDVDRFREDILYDNPDIDEAEAERQAEEMADEEEYRREDLTTYLEDMGYEGEIPSFVSKDYEGAWKRSLSYDLDVIHHDGEMYVFSNNYSLGGTILSGMIGAYIGYKIGRAKPQKKGFETEKRIGRKIKGAFSKKKMAKGGGVYSSNTMYELKVFDGKSNEFLTSVRYRARNQREANEIGQDYEYEMQQKYGDYLRFVVSEAKPLMAQGGGVDSKRTFSIYELAFGQPYNFYNEEENKFIWSEPTKATLYTKEEAVNKREELLKPRRDYYQRTGNNYKEIHIGDLSKKGFKLYADGGGVDGKKYYASISTHYQREAEYNDVEPKTIITNTKEEMVEKLNELYKKTFSQNRSPYEITDFDEKYAIDGTYISDDWSYVTTNYNQFKKVHNISLEDFAETSNKKNKYAQGGGVDGKMSFYVAEGTIYWSDESGEYQRFFTRNHIKSESKEKAKMIFIRYIENQTRTNEWDWAEDDIFIEPATDSDEVIEFRGYLSEKDYGGLSKDKFSIDRFSKGGGISGLDDLLRG